MTTNQKNLIRKSFAQVAPIAEVAAEMFYNRMFEIDPTTKPLFHGDMREQYRKLMNVMAVAVASLDSLNEILPMVRELGRKHADYGVTGAHYDAGGVALLWTLEKGLGDSFTEDTRDAWATVYGVLTSAMKSGAQASRHKVEQPIFAAAAF